MHVSYPKPRRRVLDRIAEKLAREAKDRAFRQAVWVRDAGLCQNCGRVCKRTINLTAEQGHVHHRHGRRVRPEDRFSVDAAVLFCAVCHTDPAVIARFRR